MSEYVAGSLKWEPTSKSVANRTVFPEVGDLANHAWLVATTGSGALSKTSSDVETWEPLYTQAELDAAVAQAVADATGK